MKTTTKENASVFLVVLAMLFSSLVCYYYGHSSKVYEKQRGFSPEFFEITQGVSVAQENLPQVFVSGEPFGIKLISEGLMVVDLQKGDCPAKDCGIKVGDIILSANGKRVCENADISRLIRSCDGQTIRLEILRGKEKKEVKLTPEVFEGGYRAGMWVRDSSAGIGTMTFFTKEGLFGGLGHPVCDIDTGGIVPIKNGEVSDVIIHDYEKSRNGKPGALLGGFTPKGELGSISLNVENGVYGQIDVKNFSGVSMPIAQKCEVKKGKAEILTTIDGKTPNHYEVEIKEVRTDGRKVKNLVIEVTDRELLEKTGGILQGMSGSPIIQNGKLIGAVTHVFVNDVTKGYGVFAEDMYNTAVANQKSANGQKLSA